MIFVCRILLLFAFALYWGGLTFYTGFVVRISHDVLNDPMDGGMITQRVTVILQLFGLLTALLMIWNVFFVVRQSPKYGYALGACVALLVCSLIGLFVVHEQLDAIIDIGTAEITDREAFVIGHRRYNQLTTVQWLSALIYLPITLVAWSSIDRKSVNSKVNAVADNVLPTPTVKAADGTRA
ncbi:MAG: hypothetical protein ACR2NZ_12540 [Rubripirellula sp.]